ncbi:ABC-2 transporter permease [Bacillus cereus]|nr:ABC-2 transporter permease [Bacillus cereus]
MRQLIFKELYMQRFQFVVYIILSGFAFGFDMKSQNGFLISCILLSIFAMYTSLRIDERNNSDRILNSLPLLRKHVVIAKYISFILLILISVCITVFVSFCFYVIGQFDRVVAGYYPLFGSAIPWNLAIVGFGVTLLYAILLLPIVFTFGGKIATYASMILPIIIMILNRHILPQILNVLTFVQHVLGNIPKWTLWGIGIFLLGLLTSTSISVSIQCYQRRDL